jgi:hypothetical protein
MRIKIGCVRTVAYGPVAELTWIWPVDFSHGVTSQTTEVSSKRRHHVKGNASYYQTHENFITGPRRRVIVWLSEFHTPSQGNIIRHFCCTSVHVDISQWSASALITRQTTPASLNARCHSGEHVTHWQCDRFMRHSEHKEYLRETAAAIWWACLCFKLNWRVSTSLR